MDSGEQLVVLKAMIPDESTWGRLIPPTIMRGSFGGNVFFSTTHLIFHNLSLSKTKIIFISFFQVHDELQTVHRDGGELGPRGTFSLGERPPADLVPLGHG